MVVFLFLVWPMLPLWVPQFYCSQDEINIKTGQSRHTRFCCFIKTAETIEDTALSLAVQGIVDRAEIVPWQKVNVFAPPSKHVSPHYIFHGALSQAREVELIFKLSNAPREKKKEIATQVLTLWQLSGRDDGARDYILQLAKEL